MKTFLTVPFIVRIGLACVFLANSLMAFIAPSEFQDLVSNSFVLNIVPVSAAAFVMFIGINDLAVAILLAIGWRTNRVATYAAAWLIGVIVVIGAFSLDALEHLGFLAMSVALMLRGEE